MAESSPRKKARDSTSQRSAKSKKKPESVAILRSQLKRIDRELVKRLNDRAKLVRKLCDRLAQDEPDAICCTTDSNQLELVQSQNHGPLDENAIKAIFRELISGCRALAGREQVAFLGPEYSYSHLAAIHRFGQSAALAPVTSIPAVFEAVMRGDVNYGIVPLENSTDGRITDTLGMFAQNPIRVSGEVQLRIHHNLLGRCKRSEIRAVCSKPQALSQCRKWLTDHLPGVGLVEMTSTAAAAEKAATEEGVAAVASMQAGINYGLEVLAHSIEDNQDNVTRFAIIGHESARRSGHDVTSLMFQLPHQPGALADAMGVFRRNRLNLTWIESFPLSGSPNEYLFFVELEGYESDLRVRRAITSLEKKTERLDVLGSYARSEPVD